MAAEKSSVEQWWAELNPEQRAAVEQPDGPVLVVAGPGTGKTRVIAARIAWLLETHPDLRGENILALTFNDRAAGEMKQRVLQQAGERARDVWVGTFHSFCLNEVLKPAFPELEILDDVDHWILLRENLDQLGLVKFRALAEPGRFLGDFCHFFSRCQDELVTPEELEDYVARLCQQPEVKHDEVETLRELAAAYRASERLLAERRRISFGGSLLRAVELLRQQPERRAQLQQRFQHILVDEFQDTNVAQIELLRLLGGPRPHLFVVGDDDQAIYRFRGASFGSFRLFQQYFPSLSGGPPACVLLTENYRSTQRIVRVASRVIACNADRFRPDKPLRTRRPAGRQVRLVELGSKQEQAQWVAQELERQHARGRPWSAFAVLYREHRHREELVLELARRGIPFVIRGLSIFSNTLVRDLLAYLRLLANPGDEVACARVLAAPHWGCRPEDLRRWAHAARRRRSRLLEQVRAAASSQAGLGRIEEFLDWLAQWQQRAAALSPAELLEQLLGELRLPLVADSPEQAYLGRLIEFVRQWESKVEPAQRRLPAFLRYLEYFREAGETVRLDTPPGADAVELMSVHAAKGLEFDCVFVLNLTRHAFPVPRRKARFAFPEALLKEGLPQGDFHIQEERRLFYVALTRAREELILTAVTNARQKPSPFLEDILRDPELMRDVERLQPKTEPATVEVTVGTLQPTPTAAALLWQAARQPGRAFSQIALWARTVRGHVPNPLKLSPSAIDEYRRCPMKFLFGYEAGWALEAPPGAPVLFGQVMHRVIRQFVAELKRGTPMSLEELLASYRREWPAAQFPDPYQAQEYRRVGEEQLRRFYARYTGLRPVVLAQEKKFDALPLSEDVVVTGRIDQVNRLPSGGVELVDYKTGTPKSPEEAHRSLQLSLYALAAQEVFDWKPERLVFWNLDTDELIVTSRSQEDLERARREVLEVAAQIRSGNFEPRPGYACRFCPYELICPAHEQLVPLPALSAPSVEAATDRKQQPRRLLAS